MYSYYHFDYFIFAFLITVIFATLNKRAMTDWFVTLQFRHTSSFDWLKVKVINVCSLWSWPQTVSTSSLGLVRFVRMGGNQYGGTLWYPHAQFYTEMILSVCSDSLLYHYDVFGHKLRLKKPATHKNKCKQNTNNIFIYTWTKVASRQCSSVFFHDFPTHIDSNIVETTSPLHLLKGQILLDLFEEHSQEALVNT